MNAKHGTLRILSAMSLPIGMGAATLALAGWLAVSGSRPVRPQHPGAQVIVIADLPPVPGPLLGNRTAC